MQEGRTEDKICLFLFARKSCQFSLLAKQEINGKAFSLQDW